MSGKSTLFKQMITLYGAGFTLEDRQGYTNIVYNNTISAMKILVKFSDELAEDYRDDSFRIYPVNSMSKQALQYCKLDGDVDVNLAKHIQVGWDFGASSVPVCSWLGHGTTFSTRAKLVSETT